MKQRYGATQVCEFRLTQTEVDRLVIENVAKRWTPSYDFDRDNPVLLKVFDSGSGTHDYVVRFVQWGITQDGAERHANFKPIEVLTPPAHTPTDSDRPIDTGGK